MPQKTRAELAAEVARLEAALAAKERDEAVFKSRVREKAYEVADERGWCDSGVAETLKGLGITPKEQDWTATLTVSVRFRAGDTEEWQESISYYDSMGLGSVPPPDERLANFRELMATGEIIEVSVDEIND